MARPSFGGRKGWVGVRGDGREGLVGVRGEGREGEMGGRVLEVKEEREKWVGGC